MTNFYKKLDISAFDAISKAQKIVNGPMLFQATFSLIEHGVLKALDESPKGLTLEQLKQQTDLSEYALGVLLDMGASGEIVTVSDEGVYTLSKIGFFLINDEMTKINMDFIKYICYEGADKLDASLVQRKPCGLAVFNKDWQTIYPYLDKLPGKAKEAWFNWDHLYSQTAFKDAITKLNELYKPKTIYDVGGNTGKFAIACGNQIENVKVTILDLPSQIKMAKENIHAHNLDNQIDFQAVDILNQDPNLPHDADIWWMSQFLDCFAPEHVLHILSNISKAMKDDAKVCILEPIADRQKFEASAYSINAGSLYFTCMANGYSRFFSTKMLTELVTKAGFKVENIIDGLGISNSLFILSK